MLSQKKKNMSKKGNIQSNRLTLQHKASEGVIGIFDTDAKIHDKEVYNTSIIAKQILEEQYPNLKFRYRKELSKKEINEHLNKIDSRLGKTLFVPTASIKPDGGIIEVKDDNEKWRVVLVSEAKFQGKDIENIKNGILVGKNNNQILMVAGNAIERAHKNICEIANYMLTELYFPYVIFLEGSNFLTHDITIKRFDGSTYTLSYNNGALNRLDRLTASNYGMPINQNLCENIFISSNSLNIMLQSASIYTQGNGEKWNENEMVAVMIDIAKTSLKMLSKDLFKQLTK